MFSTAEQFKNQFAFWQDQNYSYAIHLTSGGAVYLFRINGREVSDETVKRAEVFRLDGIDKKAFIENISKFI